MCQRSSICLCNRKYIFFVNVCVSTLLSHRMCVRCVCVCVCVRARMWDALATETPEGSLGMSHIPLLSGNSGLSFDSPFLPPPFFFLSTPAALSVFSFLCSAASLFRLLLFFFIFLLMAHSPDFFPSRKFFSIFHSETGFSV